jgi:hypothetical protein
MKNRKFGRFRLAIGFVDEYPEEARIVLENVIVFQAWNDAEYIYYLGAHPHFAYVPVGCDIPAYEVRFICGRREWVRTANLGPGEPNFTGLSPRSLTAGSNAGRRSEYLEELARQGMAKTPPEPDQPLVELAEYEPSPAEPEFEEIAAQESAMMQKAELAEALPAANIGGVPHEHQKREQQGQNPGKSGEGQAGRRWNGPWPLRYEQKG